MMRLVAWAEPGTDGGGLPAIIDGKPTTPLLCRLDAQTDMSSENGFPTNAGLGTVSNFVLSNIYWNPRICR